MKRKSNFKSLIPMYFGIIIIFAVLLISCSDDKSNPTTPSASVPVLTTTDSVSSITCTIAACGGNVTSDGGAAVTARGVCWSASQKPTIADSITNDGAGTGIFTSEMTGLTPETTYYVRAYATNSAGTGYGSAVSFTTLPSTPAPTLITFSVSAITDTTAACGGNVTSDGGETVTARGVCWSTSQKPTIADNKTNDGAGTGIFTSEMTGLTPETTYYVRAYATNRAGTGYGSAVSFTTLPSVSVPVLTTAGVSEITSTTAACGGTITSDGGSTVTARGVCWSASQTPTIADNITNDGAGVGSFTSEMTGLTPEITYYVRAYATNSGGTGYGAAVSFTTLKSPYGTVKDIEGNIYQTIKIGNQWWMAENLKVRKYRNGDFMPNVTGASTWTNLQKGAYCVYNNDNDNVNTYGRLYNWYAIYDSRGIAPEGWHVPTDEEYTELENYLITNGYNWDGTTSGNKIGKSLASKTGWSSSAETGDVGNDMGTNNASGFTALPGGYRSGNDGDYHYMGNDGYWWSATGHGPHIAWGRGLYYVGAGFVRKHHDGRAGFSVRCVRD